MSYARVGEVGSFCYDLYKVVKKPVEAAVRNIQERSSWTVDVISAACSYCTDICKKGLFTCASKKIDVISEEDFMKSAQRALTHEMNTDFSDQYVQTFVAASIKVLAVYAVLEIGPQKIGCFASFIYSIMQILRKDLRVLDDKDRADPIMCAICFKFLKDFMVFLSSANLSIDLCKLIAFNAVLMNTAYDLVYSLASWFMKLNLREK